MLNYNIKGTGLEVSDEIRSYLDKKLAHIEKFLGDDPSAHTDVEVKYLPEGRSGKYCTEVTLVAHGVVHRVERWGSTLHESIDLTVGELQGELSRNKQKRLHMVRRSAHKVKEYLRGWRTKL